MNFRLGSVLARVACGAGLALCFAVSALAQGALLQGGPRTQGHVPMYTTSGSGGQTVVQDSGPASGGAAGLGLSELLQVNPSSTQSSGTGVFGTHNCSYSAPVTSGSYYYLCWDASASNGGLIAYGNGGSAPALPLRFNINGTSYSFPAVLTGVVGPGSSTVGDLACWNNTAGTLLSDCTTLPAATTATTQATTDSSTKVATTAFVHNVAPRTRVLSTWNFYVTTAGNDANDCSAADNAHACATATHAYNIAVQNYDLAGINGQINVGHGTYSTCGFASFIGTPEGTGAGLQVKVLGDIASPSSVVINPTGCNAITVGDTAGARATVDLDGFTLGTVSSGNAIEVNAGSFARIGSNIVFSNTAGIHIYGHTGGNIVENVAQDGIHGYTISGNASYHLFAINNAAFIVHGVTITCTGAPNLTFAYAGQGGTLLLDQLTFSGCGSLTGSRFFADAGGSIVTNTNNVNYFPGNAAGAVQPGGVYDNIGYTSPFFPVSSSTTTPGVSLSTGTAATLVSISIPPGDWDVYFDAYYRPGATTVVHSLQTSISTSALFDGTPGQYAMAGYPAAYIPTNAFEISQKAGPYKVRVTTAAVSTTVNGVVKSTFDSGDNTMNAWGAIRATPHR